MTLRHMNIFVAVCECKSFTLAAEKLFIAQPAVSLAISELENYYGIKLFDRISRKVYITEVGKQFLSYALHITSLFDEMENGIKNWDSVGTLRIGSSITVGTQFMPLYVKRFSVENPNIKVQVDVDNSENIETKLIENKLDFAIIEGTVHSEQLISQDLFEDKLVFICGREHLYYNRESISLEELRHDDFLLREKGSGTREFLESIFLTINISIEPTWESVSTRAIINAVIAGLGISVLPLYLVKEQLNEKKLAVVKISGIDLTRKIIIIYHKNKYLSKSAVSFINLCQSMKNL